MRMRFIGVALSVGIIALALVSLVFVKKIITIGGSSYNWEYIPPFLFLGLGVGLLSYWIRRIVITRAEASREQGAR